MRSTVHQARRDDRGFVIPMTALVLIPLLVVAAFAVDVGGWYAQASKVQRAADAAALAGVVWMPNLSQAQSVAVQTAVKNGFDPSDPGVTVQVSSPGDEQLTVRITAKGDTFLGAVIGEDEPDITREATAEYAMPVPLGSPKNTFGTGDLLSGTYRENFWAAVNGYCAGHESGDLKLARYESYSTSSSGCNNGSPQTDDYDPTGYLYAIEQPADHPTLTVDVYDAGYNSSGSRADIRLAGSSQAVTTVYEVYGADDTPLDRTDNPLVRTVTVGTDDNSYRGQWRQLHRFSPAPKGTYYLRVRTEAQTNNSRASNGFGIRTYNTNSFSVCTSINGEPSYNLNCPSIHGVEDMSIFASFAGATASFFLADVNAIHAGKTMRVSLFDSGEGADSIQVLDPNGNPRAFSWSTPCNPPTPPSGGCSGTTSSLDVSGTGTQPYGNLQSASKYNDRSMVLEIPLPSDYTAQFGAKTWWRIRYQTGDAPTDRTTWSVQIIGDPVHLID